MLAVRRALAPVAARNLRTRLYAYAPAPEQSPPLQPRKPSTPCPLPYTPRLPQKANCEFRKPLCPAAATQEEKEGVKAKLYEIFTASEEPLTSNEIWAQAEVSLASAIFTRELVAPQANLCLTSRTVRTICESLVHHDR